MDKEEINELPTLEEIKQFNQAMGKSGLTMKKAAENLDEHTPVFAWFYEHVLMPIYKEREQG